MSDNTSDKEGVVRFSVIVPLYNKECYITRALESIVAQTFSDYELIVVDDGSSDGSYDIASNILSGNSKCKIVRQSNMGVAAARNNGVAISRGDFICFLDADDWWESTLLEEMDCLIRNFPSAGLYGAGFYIIKNARKRVAPIGVDKEFRSGYINYCQTYSRTMCMPITSSSVAIPREIYIDSGGFRSGITLGEDFDLWIRIALKCRVALVNKPLANYFQDLPSDKRATRRLHSPERHMLWNLDYLSEEGVDNKDIKILLDRLRVSGLYRYYLSKQYHTLALEQLSKVDWSNVSQGMYKRYHSSLQLQQLRFYVRSMAARVKAVAARLVSFK